MRPDPHADAFDPFADWDGAYVLGALGPGERRDFEAHLVGCDACRDAVAALAGLPGLLGAVGAGQGAGDEPAEGDVLPLARLAAAARRGRRRHRARLTAAGAALAVVAGVAGGLVSGSVSGPVSGLVDTSPTAPPASSAASEAARTIELVPVGDTGLHADLVATPTPWGTRLEWSCRYALTGGPAAGGYDPAEVTYQLVLVDRAGGRSVAATWTTAHPEAHGLGASSALPIEALDRVEIARAGEAAALAAAAL
ncbi:zf-HC2 domain-containing protein [Xylanimonas ulmi]|uniref:Putative zinc finger protein n=1 Tax=Xylanimonas ulmi TaxID=228973 RepID=A0A4Q7M670_9MICO|nr:zf-HC2 domain-containing protein [Xylanibacterium ulmi]RZS62527.1 putative zinc finger protein [Xylanibacterium ulmi]